MKTRDDLVALARVVALKREILHNMSCQNIFGKSAEERLDMAAQHRVAMDELFIAERVYNAALAEYKS